MTDLSSWGRDTSGPGSVEAAKMAVEEFGPTVLGKPIQIISADHQMKTDVGVQIARNWFDNGKVDAVADIPNSGIAIAVHSMVKERNKIALLSGPGASSLWKDRRARLKAVHQPRYRRDCCGELIQIDGSEHWWFEGRGPQCTLLVYIDDATSRLMHLQFVESENTFDYFAATRAYLERYGKPVAFYSDKHGVFRVNKKDAVRGDGMTQFGRALHALNIDIICANSSQAKGRVERANGTLQDRLVKEMRLSGIDTIEAGNAFLPAFMEKYNARFGKAPLEDRDLHRPLASHEDIDDAFAWKEERSVSVNLTLQYDQVLFILEPTKIARSLARKRVTVIDYPDGRLAIRYNGVDLPYRTFDKRPQVNQAALVENKRLGPILAYIAEQQKELDMSRSAKAPRRRGQKNHMFKVG
ncbi:ISNCY family transposase [Bradyrhizobium sp. KBS0727]|nr:ISNCY family transposase [Bradyrhizobium sp. KBS0725]QDW48454.1 ISNCY family transposase [Bradyrhizobium sp. KBS0727]